MKIHLVLNHKSLSKYSEQLNAVISETDLSSIRSEILLTQFNLNNSFFFFFTYFITFLWSNM